MHRPQEGFNFLDDSFLVCTLGKNTSCCHTSRVVPQVPLSQALGSSLVLSKQ